MATSLTNRELFRKVLPETPVFVLSIDKNNTANGMACGWNMKVSHEPFRFAVCLSKKSNTLQLIQESKEFVVAIPNSSLQEELEKFGTLKGEEVNKFKEVDIKVLPSKKIKTPILKDATLNFECELFKQVDVGDHIMCIGTILESYCDESKDTIYYVGRDSTMKRKFSKLYYS